MKNKTFKIQPTQVLFPISDNLDKFTATPRPIAFPLMKVKNICKETLTIGMIKDGDLLGYQTKAEPQRIHWLYPVPYKAYNELIKILYKDGADKFEALFKEHFINCYLHVVEDCMLSPEDSDLVNDVKQYNK